MGTQDNLLIVTFSLIVVTVVTFSLITSSDERDKEGSRAGGSTEGVGQPPAAPLFHHLLMAPCAVVRCRVVSWAVLCCHACSRSSLLLFSPPAAPVPCFETEHPLGVLGVSVAFQTANILVTEDFDAKIADFGLSRVTKEGKHKHLPLKGTLVSTDLRPEPYTINTTKTWFCSPLSSPSSILLIHFQRGYDKCCPGLAL